MTSTALALLPAPPPNLTQILRALRAPAPALVLGLALLGLVFSTEATTAWQIWRDSTAYSHCFFVLPIALYIAWERRTSIVATPVVALPWAVLLVIPLGFAWLVAERLAIMEGRQLVAVSVVEVLFLAVLGWRMAWAMAAPLLYLYFLVPFGAFLTPILQDWTAAFSVFGLEVLEIPHYADQYLIEIPEGRFYVAEACAGLRFLIASIAFGVLYAVLMYRSIWRRLAFVAASIAIPIVANWFRALGIVVLGHILGSAQAAAADHILYGWLFFSLVTLLLILGGLPFRQDAAPAPLPLAGPPAGRMLPLAVAVAVLAVIGPAISAGLDRIAATPLETPHFAWTTPLGCTAGTPDSPQPGAETLRFSCPQGVLTATAQVFAPRSNPATITAAQRRVTNELAAEEVITNNLATPKLPLPNWRFTVAGAMETTPETMRTGSTITASALVVNGAPARGGLIGRAILARHSILGATERPVLLAVSMHSPRPQIGPEEDRQLRQTMSTFLDIQSNLATELPRLTGG